MFVYLLTIVLITLAVFYPKYTHPAINLPRAILDSHDQVQALQTVQNDHTPRNHRNEDQARDTLRRELPLFPLNKSQQATSQAWCSGSKLTSAGYRVQPSPAACRPRISISICRVPLAQSPS